MSPEEKLEMGRKLITEAEAEIAAKKRNWPEKIEAGMLFRHRGGGVYIWPNERCENLVCLVAGEKSHCGDVFYKDLARACMDSFAYLGHARDLIKIADGSHEPTREDLVGKVCQFSDDGKNWTNGERPREQGDPRICIGYDEKSAHPYSNGWAEWKYARLAR